MFPLDQQRALRCRYKAEAEAEAGKLQGVCGEARQKERNPDEMKSACNSRSLPPNTHPMMLGFTSSSSTYYGVNTISRLLA
jgi:hypothetical protein